MTLDDKFGEALVTEAGGDIMKHKDFNLPALKAEGYAANCDMCGVGTHVAGLSQGQGSGFGRGA